MVTPEQKTIKNIPIIIKQSKNNINTNNSFLQARANYIKESYLQEQKVSSCHTAATTKYKSYRMNLVVTEHKLTFL